MSHKEETRHGMLASTEGSTGTRPASPSPDAAVAPGGDPPQDDPHLTKPKPKGTVPTKPAAG